jgi:hypothetical protein
MPYTINRYDRSILTTVIDGTIDRTTDLKLLGKNYVSYGEVQNENFLFLLENFSGTNEPPRPLSGQLWFDSGENRLKVYQGEQWESLSVVSVSATEPSQNEGSFWKNTLDNRLRYNDGKDYKTLAVIETQGLQPQNLQTGDLWWDSSNNQLYTFNGSSFDLIGPQRAGDSTTRWESEIVKDNSQNDKAIIRGYVNGETVNVISNEEFTLSDNTPIPGFDSIKKGVTLKNSQSEKGVTEPTDYWFWGTAANANYVDGLTASQFLRSDETDQLSGNLEFANNKSGLSWDSDSVNVKNNASSLEFKTDDTGYFLFYNDDGSSVNDLFKIDTQDGVNGLTFRNNIVWHAGNDGSGSGLDADTLDGFNSSEFLGVNEQAIDSDKLNGLGSEDFVKTVGDEITGDLTLNGNSLAFKWDNSQFNSAALRFFDNSNSDSRLEFQVTDDSNEYFVWKAMNASYTAGVELLKLDTIDDTDGFTFRNNRIWHEGNQGPASGLDADTLDGVEATGFLPIDGKAVDAERADRTPLADRSLQADNADTVGGFDQSLFYRKTGGPVSDFITLHANPVDDFHAATKSYIDSFVADRGYAIYHTRTAREYPHGGDVPLEFVDDSYNIGNNIQPNANQSAFTLVPGYYKISYYGRFYEINSSPPVTLTIKNKSSNELLRYTEVDAELDGGAEHNTISFSFPFAVNDETEISLYANTNSHQRARLSWATLMLELIQKF